MKIFKYLLLLMPVLCITSCVQDEDNIFDEAPAVRMQKAIDEYKALLTDAPNGWIIHYYPENKYAIGAFAMSCKFSADGKVEAACEVTTNVKPHETAVSTWDVIPYAGPTLTFDTYNPVVHYFSEVTSSSDRDGRAGDYDFVITKAVKDTFYLSGLKNNNKMVMFKSSGNPIDYLKQVSIFSGTVTRFSTFNILQNGDSTGTVKMSTTISNDLLNRAFTANYSNGEGDTTVTCPFYFTPDALVLHNPLEIKGASISKLAWDRTNTQYVAEGSNIVFRYVGQKTYSYEDFLGNYKLLYSSSNATTATRNRTLDVSIEPEIEGLTYKITGILPDSYPEAKLIGLYVAGSFKLMGQITYKNPDSGYDLWWLPYSFPSGGSSYVSQNAALGVVVSDLEENGGKLKFNLVDNKIWGSYTMAGFMIRNYDNTTNAGNVNGKDGQPYYFHLRFEKQ